MRTIKANFHTHTNASFDGYNSYKAIYSRAKEVGLNAIAITDHDTIEGALGLKKWLSKNNKKDLEVIIGEEVTCLDGTHIIGLYLKKHINSESPLNVVREIKSQNGLVYFPHPARKDGIMESDEFPEIIGYGDYFEVYNGKVNKSYNEKAIVEYQKHKHMLPLGGSDAHYNADLTKCICYIDLTDEQSLEEALRKKSLGNVQIMGYQNHGSVKYFGSYYKVKEKLNLPQFIRDIGKVLFPLYKNYKERNKVFKVEKVYDYNI